MKELSDFNEEVYKKRQEYQAKLERIGSKIPFDLIYSESIRNKEIPKKVAGDYKLFIEKVKEMEYFIKNFKVKLTENKLYLINENYTIKIFEGTDVNELYKNLYKKVKEIIPKLQDDLPF